METWPQYKFKVHNRQESNDESNSRVHQAMMGQKKKVIYIRMGYYSASKRNEILTFYNIVKPRRHYAK